MGAEFDGKKNVVVGRGAGIARQAAFDVIDRGGTGGRGRGSATYASS